MDSKTKTYDITGMTCDNCVKHVTSAVEALPGVTGVKVHLASNTAEVEGDVDPQQVIEAVEEEGYEATPR